MSNQEEARKAKIKEAILLKCKALEARNKAERQLKQAQADLIAAEDAHRVACEGLS